MAITYNYNISKITASFFEVEGGTSSQFLKADGSVDSNTYITTEANDLSTVVTWAIVPDAYISQSSVTQHEGALTITQSQISDLNAVELDDLSVTTNPASGGGSLSYDNLGTFTYTPPFPTLDSVTINGNTTTNTVLVGSLGVGAGITFPSEAIEVAGNVEAIEFIGQLRGPVLFKAKSGEDLLKGDVVYISGISGQTTVVSKADANDPTKMPAFGLVSTDSSNNSACEVVTFGTLSGVDTNIYTEGEELYVSTTPGLMVSSPPTGESSQIQKIAKVTRSAQASGSLKVMGAGRTNAVPNLNNGNIFIGNALNQAETRQLVEADISDLQTYYLASNPNNYISSYTVTEGDVTQHQAALSITESQISDFGTYITTETDPIFSAHTTSNIIDGTGRLQNDGIGNWSYDNSTYYLASNPNNYISSYTVTQGDVTQHQAALSITESQISDLQSYQLLSEKGAASGYASLDASGKVLTTQLPALALTEVSVVADQTARLALTAQEGDVAIQTDTSTTFIHNGGTAGTNADWEVIEAPVTEVDPVFSAHTTSNIVNGVGFLKNNNGAWSYDNSTYLTSEADTLATVTARGAVTTTTSIIPFLYANQAAFPSASTYHGAIAHSHADGAMYFAHGSVWNKLANDSQLSSYYLASNPNNYISTAGEINDLTANVTWANVPDLNITQTSVTQHQAALSITESQISDLQNYLTSYTETQTLDAVTTLGNTTTNNVTVGDLSSDRLTVGVLAGSSVGMVEVKTAADGYAISLEENSGNETYQIGINPSGDFLLYNSKSTTPTFIVDDGNRVGINVDPSVDLDIADSTLSDTCFVRVRSSTDSGYMWHDTSQTVFGLYWDVSKDYLQFYDEVVNTERGHIKSDGQFVWTGGNVGIGTDAPAVELDVASAAPQLRLTDTDGGYCEVTNVGGNLLLQADKGNSQASSYMRFDVDATERMRITSGGNVGVGNPGTNAKLEVTATSGEVFRADAAGGAYRIVANQTGVSLNGNVGIGNTTPIYGKVVVNSAGSAATNTSVGTTPSHLYLNDSASSPTGQAVNIDFGYNAGNVATSTARIGAINNTAVGTQLYFSTSANYGAMPIERMRVDEVGNLLVGTTSVSGFLNSTTETGSISYSGGFIGATASSDSAAYFKRLTDDGPIVTFRNSSAATVGSISSEASGAIGFYGSGGTGAVIDSSGNVGIGTDSPAQLLTVNDGMISLETAEAETGRIQRSTGEMRVSSVDDLVFRSGGVSAISNDRMRITASGNVSISSTTASTSTSTGALTVAGGAGIGGTVTATGATLSGLSAQASEATALMINGSNVVGTRELGSNAFNSTAFLTGNQTITLSGDVTGSGTTSIATTITSKNTPLRASSLAGSVNLDTLAQQDDAGFYYQLANSNAASGSNYPVSRAGSLFVQKGANSTGYGTTQMYIDYNDSTMYLRSMYGSGSANRAWVTMLSSGNYNLYSPTLTGTGASGTWGIGISGNAATATTAAACSGLSVRATRIDYRDGRTDSTAYPILWGADESGYTLTYSCASVKIKSSTAEVQANRFLINNGGTFFSDAAGRIATTADFYVQATSGNTYLYSTNTYLGNTSGDSIRCRGNTISGNSWSMTGAGALSTVSATLTGALTGRVCTTATFITANDLGSISIRGNTTKPAVMSFHRTSAYAVNFGLDTDNHLKMGGWSASSIKHTWQNSGNYLAVGNVTAYSSDKRLKENIVNIPNALDKVMSLNGVTFDWKEEKVKSLGFEPSTMVNEIGVLAQEIEAVIPQATAPAPFDLINVDGKQESKSGEDYLTVQYEKIVPLLIEAIKEQQAQIEELKERLNGLT